MGQIRNLTKARARDALSTRVEKSRREAHSESEKGPAGRFWWGLGGRRTGEKQVALIIENREKGQD